MKGGDTLSPEQALRVLDSIWLSETPQLAVVPIHWTRVDPEQMRRPIFADFANSSATVAAVDTTSFLGRFQRASPGRRRSLLLEHVMAATAKVLGLKGTANIDPMQGFFELGMDSLTSVELRNHLRGSLRCDLPMTATFDYPTPNELADFLLRKIAPAGAIHEILAVAVEQPDEEVADLAELPISELEMMIDAIAKPLR
jgi:acyl carrier protein